MILHESTDEASSEVTGTAAFAQGSACNMANMSRPQFMINIPPPSFRRNTASVNIKDDGTSYFNLTCDRALQFTPVTTSVLRPCDRIPIPEVSRVRENGRITSSLEKKQAQAAISQQNSLGYADEIAAMINQSCDTNLYGYMHCFGKR